VVFAGREATVDFNGTVLRRGGVTRNQVSLVEIAGPAELASLVRNLAKHPPSRGLTKDERVVLELAVEGAASDGENGGR
jgi:hypothetical protein